MGSVPISPSIKATKELKSQSKKSIQKQLELRNLITGDSIQFKRAKSMTFSEDESIFAIL